MPVRRPLNCSPCNLMGSQRVVSTIGVVKTSDRCAGVPDLRRTVERVSSTALFSQLEAATGGGNPGPLRRVSERTRWVTAHDAGHAQWYSERFRRMAAEGVDLNGEAGCSMPC